MADLIWKFRLADNNYPPNPDLDQPPVKVLDALAAEIKEATEGLLEGNVDTITLDMTRYRFGRPEEMVLYPLEHWRQQSTFVHALNIGCPRLMHYQFRILSAVHGPHLYPCQIMAPNAITPWMEVEYDSSPTYLISTNPYLEARDESDLRDLLHRVMNSRRVYTMINSLLSQAYALGHRDRADDNSLAKTE